MKFRRFIKTDDLPKLEGGENLFSLCNPEFILNMFNWNCEDCDYNKCNSCPDNTIKKALKKQIAVKPKKTCKTIELHTICAGECPVCGKFPLTPYEKYCSKCGNKLLWEDDE